MARFPRGVLYHSIRAGADSEETGRVGEMWHFEVSGEEIQTLQMIPGYTHSITDLSDTEPLIMVMLANEVNNPARLDTYADSFVM